MTVPQTAPKSYGFIGLGVMGYGMAHNLRQKIPVDCEFYVCELVKERRDQWLAEARGKVKLAESPKEVAENCDVIITMLPRGEHVRHVFTNKDDGLLTANIPGKVFIDCSTIEIDISKQVAASVEESGLGLFVDAPVSGSVGGANAGTLTFMVGCPSDSLFSYIKSILDNMGKPENVFHCGGIGAGLATKQINNYMSAGIMLAVCEGMNMGRLYGLDPKVLAGVVNVSTGMSHNGREQNPVKGVSKVSSASKDFVGGFSIELCKGVLDMGMKLSQDLGAKSVLAPVIDRTYNKALQSEKCKGHDYRSVYRLFSENDGHDLD